MKIFKRSKAIREGDLIESLDGVYKYRIINIDYSMKNPLVYLKDVKDNVNGYTYSFGLSRLINVIKDGQYKII